MESITAKRSNHGANVRRWREWRNIKQDVLAEQIGVSQATLSTYEKKDKLEEELIERIAKALDIPVEAITELEQGNAINIFSGAFSDFKDNSAILNSYPTFNPIDKVDELYERLLKEKESVIELMKDLLKEKK